MKFPSLDPFSFIERARKTPSVEGVKEFEVSGMGGIPIAGWALKRENAVGTLFHLHGFCSDSGNIGGYGGSLLDLTETFGLNLVSHDSRHHGRSGDAFPTFGSAESFDLVEVMNWAEEQGFAAPFLLLGDSLGAMTAQRTAMVDSRVQGAFLMNPPAWPWDAVGVAIGNQQGQKWLVPLAGTIVNAAYHKDILGDGDIRRFPPSPDHLPFIVCVIGSGDHYGWEKTKLAFDHWYHDQPQRLGTTPCLEPDARKWFVLVDGAEHPGEGGRQVWHDEAFPGILDSFLARCLRSQE